MRYVIFFIYTIFSYSAYAFQVKPMVFEVQPTGSQSQQTMRVLNDSNVPLTIEISAYNLLIGKSGTETLKPNEDDFLIIPLTTIIPPGKSQSVIIRYIGDPLLSASKAYRIAINQVVVDLGSLNKSGVGMAVSFKTLLNVVPKEAEAKLVIKGKQQSARDSWNVMLENKGNKYIRLSKSKWIIKNKDKKMVLDGEALNKALTGKLLLPNSNCEVTIKVPSQFNADNSELEVVL